MKSQQEMRKSYQETQSCLHCMSYWKPSAIKYSTCLIKKIEITNAFYGN